MKAMTIKAILILLLGAAVGFWIEGVRSSHLVSEYAPKVQAEEQRRHDGPYTAFEKTLAPGETLKQIVIPGGVGAMDKHCMVYINALTSSSTMSCDSEPHFPHEGG
jgi:hypothetical protein